MLDMYEQKVLMTYLINAVDYMKNDWDSSFCLRKISSLIETVQDTYKAKQICFNLTGNIDYNSVKDAKKLYSVVANDVIKQLKTQLSEFKIKKISSREKTFRLLKKLFKLNDDEIDVFKLFCRNEIDDTICDVLCVAQRNHGRCDIPGMCLHYLNIKKSQYILDKLVDIGLLYNHVGSRGFSYSLPHSVRVVIESNCSKMN